MKSRSGVTPITVFTKPYQCGGTCMFCPSANNVPRSYLPRVDLSKKQLTYSAGEQIAYWLPYVHKRGGIGGKLEMIILGGSFASHSIDYINYYILDLYRAIDGPLHTSSSVKE